MAAHTRSNQTISAFDARNRLGRYLDRIEAGEELVITRHGGPVARLVPIGNRTAEQVEQALAAYRKVRQIAGSQGCCHIAR